MKNEIRLALLCLSAATVPAFAQNALPRCGSSNFDQTLKAYTILNPGAGPANQQCLVTVYPKGAVPSQARQDPASYLVEGSYVIDLTGGGGGGGGGGGAKSKGKGSGGGGGGASAAPSRTVQYLSPGEYKLTIGTGGEGGSVGGGRTGSGNPTSLTNANTGQLIAGFPGADVAKQQYQAAGSGAGGVAAPGGTSGVAGGTGDKGGQVAAGGSGGGGTGTGAGGAGESRRAAAQPGGRGGPGLIRLTMSEPARQAVAPPVVVPETPRPAVMAAPAEKKLPAPAAIRPARRDRN